METFDETSIIETHISSIQGKSLYLQEYGVGIFKATPSKSALKKAIKKKLVTVNGHVARTSTLIHGGESIVLHRAAEIPNKRIFVLPLEIIFEDDDLALINKPAGILVSGNAFKTITNALRHNLSRSNQIDAIIPQPAHRLDFPTSGLLLIGKTNSTLVALNHLFEAKGIAKSYFAVTIGKMQKEQTIDVPIDGKEALSTYVLLETVDSKRFGYLNLVQLFPKTGRRHQLRKHLAAIGNPILGDAEYGIEGKILKGNGLYLHAFSLEFVHPSTNKKMYFEKELPRKFTRIFKKSRP